MFKGQMTLLGAYDYDDGQDLSELTVATELVSSSEIGGVKPEIFGNFMSYINHQLKKLQCLCRKI